jgi:hypothetical protein
MRVGGDEMKVVINKCWGGFGLSKPCRSELAKIKGKDPKDIHNWDEWLRTDADLISLIEARGSKWASDDLAKLKIVEVPDGISWHIHDYDGQEHVAQSHKTWG